MSQLLLSSPLLRTDLAAGVLASVLLSLLGVFVMVRGRICFGAALSHVSMLGAAFALSFPVLLSVHDASALCARALAIAFAAAPAIVIVLALPYVEAARESPDALFAWLILATSSAALPFLARNGGWTAAMDRLVTSSTLSATSADVTALAVLLACMTLLIVTSRGTLLLLAIDRPTAEAAGIRAAAWSATLACLMGIAVGCSVRVTGLLFTFAFLVLPALAARSACREIGSWFAVAPAFALASAVPGFLAAERFDLAPGHTAVLIQAAAVIPAWLVRRVTCVRKRRPGPSQRARDTRSRGTAEPSVER